MGRRSRRTVVAVVGSLAVHAGVLVAVVSAPSPSTPTPSYAVPIELTEVKWVTVAPPAPAASVTTAPRGTSSGSPREMKTRSTSVSASSPTPSSSPREASIDSPRAVDLTPTVGLSGLGEIPLDAPRGRTLMPADQPGADELLADETARVEARVGGWLHSDLAQARARGGLPDPEYGLLGASLRGATREVPKFIDTNDPKAVARAFKESWLAGAERYGKTGAQWSEPDGYHEAFERPMTLVDAANHGVPEANAIMGFLSAGARLQEFADGRAGLELYALVEIRQSAAGTMEHVSLARPSGLPPFDAWVLERATTVTEGFTYDGGTRTRPLRSVWRFDGILKFRRKLKPGEFDARAAVGMLTMGALSALANTDWSQMMNPSAGEGDPNRLRAPRMPGLTGRFDETTGALDVVDFTNPTYDCKVTLLEAD